VNNRPPTSEALTNAEGKVERGWSNWIEQVFLCLAGWKRSINATKTHDFGLIAAQSEASTTAAVDKARQGDAVQVTPLAHTAGISYCGVVTAADTVTIYAQNFTAGAIDPASTTFRIIVLQN
jgi:hypothetical protein